MENPDSAELLFEEIVGKGIDALEKMVDTESPTFENDWLEFKSLGPDEQLARRDRIVKEKWSEALSGFANSGGGVLVWGVLAAKKNISAENEEPSIVDCAHELKPIPNLSSFESRLNELRRSATDPPVMGVRIHAITAREKTDDGFLICYIPQGSNPPYRAEHKDQNFYYRAGDSFLRTPISHLRRLFYPQASSDLRPLIVVSGDSKGSVHRIGFLLYNNGVLTAENPVLHIKVPDFASEIRPREGWNVGSSVALQEDTIVIESKIHLHPKSGAFAADLTHVMDAHKRFDFHLGIEIKVFCTDTRPLEFSIDYDLHDLDDCKPKWGKLMVVSDSAADSIEKNLLEDFGLRIQRRYRHSIFGEKF